jgi:hypothetical protein
MYIINRICSWELKIVGRMGRRVLYILICSQHSLRTCIQIVSLSNFGTHNFPSYCNFINGEMPV